MQIVELGYDYSPHTSGDVLTPAKKLVESIVVVEAFFRQQFFDDLRTCRLLADA